MSVRKLVIGFRLAVSAQAAALLAQAALAGFAVSGNAAALAAHMRLGGATLLVSAGQVVLVSLSRRAWGGPMADGRQHRFDDRGRLANGIGPLAAVCAAPPARSWPVRRLDWARDLRMDAATGANG